MHSRNCTFTNQHQLGKWKKRTLSVWDVALLAPSSSLSSSSTSSIHISGRRAKFVTFCGMMNSLRNPQLTLPPTIAAASHCNAHKTRPLTTRVIDGAAFLDYVVLGLRTERAFYASFRSCTRQQQSPQYIIDDEEAPVEGRRWHSMRPNDDGPAATIALGFGWNWDRFGAKKWNGKNSPWIIRSPACHVFVD